MFALLRNFLEMKTELPRTLDCEKVILTSNEHDL